MEYGSALRDYSLVGVCVCTYAVRTYFKIETPTDGDGYGVGTPGT